MVRSLALYEEILLLALHDERGTDQIGFVPHLLAGALLAESARAGRIEVQRGMVRRVIVVDPGPTGDEEVDRALSEMAEAGRPRSVSSWLGRLAKGELRARVAGRLMADGILSEERSRVLGLFPRTTYPEADPSPELHLVARLEAAIASDSAVDDRTRVVLTLVDGVGLLSRVVDRRTVRHRKQRIRDLTRAGGDDESTPLGQALDVASIAASTVMAMHAG